MQIVVIDSQSFLKNHWCESRSTPADLQLTTMTMTGTPQQLSMDLSEVKNWCLWLSAQLYWALHNYYIIYRLQFQTITLPSPDRVSAEPRISLLLRYIKLYVINPQLKLHSLHFQFALNSPIKFHRHDLLSAVRWRDDDDNHNYFEYTTRSPVDKRVGDIQVLDNKKIWHDIRLFNCLSEEHQFCLHGNCHQLERRHEREYALRLRARLSNNRKSVSRATRSQLNSLSDDPIPNSPSLPRRVTVSLLSRAGSTENECSELVRVGKHALLLYRPCLVSIQPETTTTELDSLAAVTASPSCLLNQ